MTMNSRAEEIANLSLNKNGGKKQALKLLEEMSELSVEIHNLLDDDIDIEKLASEMVDVEIMLESVRLYCSRLTSGKFMDLYEVEMNYKTARQEVRLKHQL